MHRHKESSEQSAYDELLEQCSKQELISLIKKMLRRKPDLDTLLLTVKRPQESVNSLTYQRQVENILRSSGHEWGAAREIAEELDSIKDTVDRLLELARVDEAIKEARQVDDYDLMAIADIFVRRGHSAEAESLITRRAATSSDTRLLEWLKKYYLSRNDKAKGLEIAIDLFKKQPPVLAYYQEIRLLAKMLNRWDSLRPILIAYLKETKQTYLLIQIALNDNDVEEALVLLKTSQVQSNATAYGNSYFYSGSGIDIEVARAAEEKQPRESIEIYQNRINRLINQRGRDSYQQAAQHLLRVRELFNKLGESEQWTIYITSLRDKNRPLRALKEELQAAGLI